MRRFALIATALVVSSCGALFATLLMPPVTAQELGHRVSVVNFDGAPIQISNGRVVSSSKPAGVAVQVLNASNRPIAEYSVRTYVFRANGRPLGFWRSTDRHGVIKPGVSTAFLINLRDVVLEPDSVLVFALEGTLTDDDRTRWMAPDDSVARAKAAAAQLTGIAVGKHEAAPANGIRPALYGASDTKPLLSLIRRTDYCG